MIESIAPVWAMSALSIMMLVTFVYFVVLFTILYVVAFFVIEFFVPIIKILRYGR